MGPTGPAPTDRWNPWSALQGRPDIEFRLDPIAALLGGGFYARQGHRRAIVLDPALSRRRRRTALAHELIHDERGSGCDHRGAPTTWDAVAAREEAAVDAEVARRLVPTGELRAIARARSEDGDPFALWEVADEFDVDEHIATLALGQVGVPDDPGGEASPGRRLPGPSTTP